VSSLLAQANEHRLIKERLQAAVAAALSGDVSADMQSAPPLPSDTSCLPDLDSVELGQQLAVNAESAGSASVVDLQDAISSLKVMPAVLRKQSWSKMLSAQWLKSALTTGSQLLSRRS
jgi:hypothetical protein